MVSLCELHVTILLTRTPDFVASIRAKVFNGYWMVWNEVYMSLLHDESLTCECTVCCDESRRLCQRSLLGSLLQEFLHEGLPLSWLTNGDDVITQRSLCEVEGCLLRINLEVAQTVEDSLPSTYGLIPATPVEHTMCDLTAALHQKTRKVSNNMENFSMPSAMYGALNQQRRKWDLR